MTIKYKEAQVLLPRALPGTLTYLIPEEEEIPLGSIVRVPIGKRHDIGVIWSFHPAKEAIAAYRLRPIEHIFPTPVFPENFRRFIDWVASYTLSLPGVVLKMALSVPAALTPPPPCFTYQLGQWENIRMGTARKKIHTFLSSREHATLQDICETCQVTPAVVKELIALKALHPIPQQDAIPSFFPKDNTSLSPEQHHASQHMLQKLEDSRFHVTLLDGVTGSGKTEVYMAAIEKMLHQSSGQALILLPEIALSTHMVERIEKRLGFPPAIWHSGISMAKKASLWRDVSSGKTKLVIGARSALFLPFKHLKCIVVDEEHDSSYKQEEGAVYHARDMAIVRASMEQIPILLSSATPSLETVLNVAIGKYERLHLPRRYGGATFPDITLVDLKQHAMGPHQFISPVLRKALTENLARGKQAMIFLNRRGYAPLTLCRQCGHRFQCPYCSSWLVSHKHLSLLLCHHCGHKATLPPSCPVCQGKQLTACGPGVERIMEELTQVLPTARCLELTSDSTTSLHHMSEAMGRIREKNIDVIVGTQIIAKGHHFPDLTLVGIIDADMGLAGGDIRAAERSYQLLHQVAGRAGREKDKGTVYIQSYMPGNAVIQALATGDRDAFLAQEGHARKQAFMPPFSRLIALVISGKKESEVKEGAQHIARHFPPFPGIQLLGPAPAPLFLLRSNYRYRLLLKAPRNFPLQEKLRNILATVTLPPSLRVKIDVDPINFL